MFDSGSWTQKWTYQDGLSMSFKEYQLEAIRVLCESNPGLLSQEVREQVNQHSDINISRASIINFLNIIVEIGVLTASTEMGKGEHRLRYSPKYDEAQLK